MLKARNIFAKQADVDKSPDKAVQETSHRMNSDLLQRLKDGEDRAWQQLMDEWNSRLYKYLQSKLPTKEDAEDVLNETWMGTVRGIQNFDGAVAISTFVYTIANRRVVDFWRRRKDVSDLSEEIPTKSVLGSESMEFQELLAQLPEQSREALILRYHIGLNVNEVAEIIGRSYKGTESLLSRARQQLKETMEGDR